MAEHFDVSPRIDFRVGGVTYELDGDLESLTTEWRAQVDKSSTALIQVRAGLFL